MYRWLSSIYHSGISWHFSYINHPQIDETDNGDSTRRTLSARYELSQKEMEIELSLIFEFYIQNLVKLINNQLYNKENNKDKKVNKEEEKKATKKNKDFSHAIVFVCEFLRYDFDFYADDLNTPETYDIVHDYLEAFIAAEETNHKGFDR